jgi:hypothetical protein
MIETLRTIVLTALIGFSLVSPGGLAETIQVDAQGIKIDGRYRLIRGGSLQWFRLPPEVWRDRMQKFKAAGFNTIGMHIAWNEIEPRPGVFNFSSPDIRRFLEMAQDEGLYVVVRPGPYITNEMDGGGLPAWLTQHSTKRSFQADGRVHLRSHDPDFIGAVNHYFSALNAVLKPYLITTGGPIIMYAIENEYTWFERSFKVDKLFWHQGTFERKLRQQLPTRPYMTALRDIVRDNGIDVPIVTCPGDGKVSATGDVAGVIPFPSIYEWANPDQPEQIAYDLIADMHHPEHHSGVYTDVPAGSLEINRSPQEFRRLIMGGLDALFGFNMVGMIQEGYKNSLTLAARAFDAPPHWGPPTEEPEGWLNTIFEFDRLALILTGFVSPDLGYFGNVIDYKGAISPSGVLRDIFFQYRRDNMFFDTVEPYLAPLERPSRSGAVSAPDSDLVIDHPELGVRQQSGLVHYWFRSAAGPRFVELVNQTGQRQTLAPQSITVEGRTIPQYTTMEIPPAAEPKLTYAHILPLELPIAGRATLHYSTSELLTTRSFNDETLMVVYGPEGAQGELQIEIPQFAGVEYISPTMEIADVVGETLTLVYRHQDLAQAVFELTDGTKLRVMVTNRALAGRFWFTSWQGRDILLVGADYLTERPGPQGENQLVYQTGGTANPLYLVSPEPFHFSSPEVIEPFQPQTGVTRIAAGPQPSLPLLPELNTGRMLSDRRETRADYDDRHWVHWEGEPRSLESLGFYRGHNWYRTEFYLENTDSPELDHLYVESASDIVGIYVNGQYVTTLSPVGTEINNNTRDWRYWFTGVRKFLKPGRNTIVFRTEIWGHGSFMFGRGSLLFTRASLPALGYEGEKGLSGTAKIGDILLTSWSAANGLTGEKAGYPAADFVAQDWQRASIPLDLVKGDILWYRTTFRTEDLPDPNQLAAPVVLNLKGWRTKATIFVNGRLLGRWLSDSEWLSRGSWANAIRQMWVPLNADHFPVPYELLHQDGRDNVVAIAIEDTSDYLEPAGQLEQLSLEYNEENFQWLDDRLQRTQGVRAKSTFVDFGPVTSSQP